MQKCPFCGAENANDSKFCENCGKELTPVNPTNNCPQCGQPRHGEDRFCENCGFDFNSANQIPVDQVPVDQVQPVKPINNQDSVWTDQSHDQQQPVAQPALSEMKQPNKKLPWIILLVVILIAIGGGAGYWVYSNSRPTSQATSKSKNGTKSATQSKKTSTINFDEATIKADIKQSIGGIAGTNSVYVSPVDSKQTVIENEAIQRSASCIKLFILATAYAQSEDGRIDLDAKHTLTETEKVGGTGVLREMAAGTQLTYQAIMEHMIDDSDNTAANIMIDELGGFSAINKESKRFGATGTTLKRKMMDTAALTAGRDNMTTAADMGTVLKKMYNHQLVSKQADNEMLSILEKNNNHTKLPKDLPADVTVYNKTGEYDQYGVQNDAAVIKNDQGAFVVVVLSENGVNTEQKAAMNQLGNSLYQDILG